MTYNLFISHSWSYADQYEGLVRLLDAKPYFDYRNYSVPRNDPIHNARYDWQLREAIKRQMSPASCVIILAGVYSTYSKWIKIEIELAKSMGKRIIAVEPWASERTSSVVKNAADKLDCCSLLYHTASFLKSPFLWGRGFCAFLYPAATNNFHTCHKTQPSARRVI